eukprot:XP_001699753.1 predicted protein [Chlamydomonas reinhardtii]
MPDIPLLRCLPVRWRGDCRLIMGHVSCAPMLHARASRSPLGLFWHGMHERARSLYRTPDTHWRACLCGWWRRAHYRRPVVRALRPAILIDFP